MTTDDPARLITEADRQRALTVLRRAAEDGRLTPTALDERSRRVREVLLVGQLHVCIQFGRPAVTEKAGDSDVQYAVVIAQRAMGRPLLLLIPDDRATGMAMEDPLGGIVGVGFG